MSFELHPQLAKDTTVIRSLSTLRCPPEQGQCGSLGNLGSEA